MVNRQIKLYCCLFLLAIGASACDESQGFSPDATTPSGGSIGTATTTSTGSNTPTPPPGSTVCGGFSGLGGGSGTTNQSNGLQASLNYIPFSDFSDCNEYSAYYTCNSPGPLNQDNLKVSSFLTGATDVVTTTNQIFLSSLDFPDQEFYEGMTTPQGTPLKDQSGNTLIADFALFIQGSIMLNAGDTLWPAGNYQLAILTDDGAILYVDPTGTGKNFQQWIGNDETRSNTLACATQTIALTPGNPIPIKMSYFQGPPVRIALMLLWRKLPSTTIPAVMSTDPSISPPINLCGYEADDAFYFSQAGTPAVPAPTANYETLLKDGWAPIPAANLYLPTSVINPCTS